MNAIQRSSLKIALNLSHKVVSQPKFFFVGRISQLSTLKYTKSHEYINLDGDIGIVGITDHAANALGDVVFVDLPSKGISFSSGDSFGSVESVKAASDVYSPVSGEIIEANSLLETAPGTVNESPFEKGWFVKIKVGEEGKKQFDSLLDKAAYDKHIEDTKH